MRRWHRRTGQRHQTTTPTTNPTATSTPCTPIKRYVFGWFTTGRRHDRTGQRDEIPTSGRGPASIPAAAIGPAPHPTRPDLAPVPVEPGTSAASTATAARVSRQPARIGEAGGGVPDVAVQIDIARAPAERIFALPPPRLGRKVPGPVVLQLGCVVVLAPGVLPPVADAGGCFTDYLPEPIVSDPVVLKEFVIAFSECQVISYRSPNSFAR